MSVDKIDLILELRRHHQHSESLAVLIVASQTLSFAIFLYLYLDQYKLLLWDRCPSITSSTVVSLNSHHSLNYCVRGRYIISTRHAPCPKYGAQMTTMMNTPRGIHDFKTDWRTPPITSVRTDWRKNIQREFITSRSVGQTLSELFEPARQFCFLSNKILVK